MARSTARSPQTPAGESRHRIGLAAQANYALAWLALGVVVLSLVAFALGWYTNDPHAGLWGAFAAVWVGPFVPAFWLAGRAWARHWRLAPLLQFLPLLVLLGWSLVGRWLSASAGAPTT